MKFFPFIFISLFFCVAYGQQSEETFRVKKPRSISNKEFPKIFDLKLGGIGDTICGGITIDLSPAQGYYDSISVVTLKKVGQPFGTNTYFYEATARNGHAIITFYKKEKDGSFKMVYFRNWVIHCEDKYLK